MRLTGTRLAEASAGGADDEDGDGPATAFRGWAGPGVGAHPDIASAERMNTTIRRLDLRMARPQTDALICISLCSFAFFRADRRGRARGRPVGIDRE
jgi:hypothetical protein